MKLTTKGQYTLRAALVITCRQQNERAITLASIAAQEGISLPYLEQLFQRLRRAGIMRSLRGPGGGYRTARDPAEITLYDLIQAVEEEIEMPRCAGVDPDSISCHAASVCGCKDIWEEFMTVVVTFFSSITLADLQRRTMAKQLSLGVSIERLQHAVAAEN